MFWFESLTIQTRRALVDVCLDRVRRSVRILSRSDPGAPPWVRGLGPLVKPVWLCGEGTPANADSAFSCLAKTLASGEELLEHYWFRLASGTPKNRWHLMDKKKGGKWYGPGRADQKAHSAEGKNRPKTVRPPGPGPNRPDPGQNHPKTIDLRVSMYGRTLPWLDPPGREAKDKMKVLHWFFPERTTSRPSSCGCSRLTMLWKQHHGE